MMSLSFSTFPHLGFSLAARRSWEQPEQVRAAAELLQIPAHSNPHPKVGFVTLLQAHKAVG